MRCETCQSEATIHIAAVGFHFCDSCLRKINKRIAEVADNKCSNCGGLGVVDVGALMSAWGTMPCPACAEDRNELIAIGASWKRDSSLEKWFPMTAEELRRLKAENIRQAEIIVRIKREADSLTP